MPDAVYIRFTMSSTVNDRNPITLVFSYLGAYTVSVLVSGLTAAVAMMPMASGGEGMAQVFLSLLLLGGMLASVGALPVLLSLVVLTLMLRRHAPAILQRELMFTALMGAAGSALATLTALAVTSVTGIPWESRSGIEIRSVMLLSAAVGGVVLGTMMARTGNKRRPPAPTVS